MALRRAKSMKPFVSATDLDARALHGLVRDSLLATPMTGDDHFAPAHDVFEDWALAHWLDAEFERSERRLATLFVQVGTYPALRRSYRKWLIDTYAQRIYDAIQKDGFYVRVASGKQFYLYVVQTIDRADAEIGGSEKPFAEDTATGVEKPDARAAFTAVPPTFQSTSTPIKP